MEAAKQIKICFLSVLILLLGPPAAQLSVAFKSTLLVFELTLVGVLILQGRAVCLQTVTSHLLKQ